MQSASCSSRMRSAHIIASQIHMPGHTAVPTNPRIQLRSCIWWKASSPAPRWRRRALGTALGSVDLRLAIVHIIIALACARMCVCACVTSKHCTLRLHTRRCSPKQAMCVFVFIHILQLSASPVTSSTAFRWPIASKLG